MKPLLKTSIVSLAMGACLCAAANAAQESETVPSLPRAPVEVDPQRVVPLPQREFALPPDISKGPPEAARFWAVPPAPIGEVARDTAKDQRGGVIGLEHTVSSLEIHVMNPNGDANASIQAYCRDGDGKLVSEHSASAPRLGFAEIAIQNDPNNLFGTAADRWCIVSGTVGVLVHAYLVEYDIYERTDPRASGDVLTEEAHRQPISAFPIYADRD